MKAFLLGILQSTEGACCAIGILWLAAIRFLGAPPVLETDIGPGGIAPAYLFLIAFMRIIPKIAKPGTVPFKPTPVSSTQKEMPDGT